MSNVIEVGPLWEDENGRYAIWDVQLDEDDVVQVTLTPSHTTDAKHRISLTASDIREHMEHTHTA